MKKLFIIGLFLVFLPFIKIYAEENIYYTECSAVIGNGINGGSFMNNSVTLRCENKESICYHTYSNGVSSQCKFKK